MTHLSILATALLEAATKAKSSSSSSATFLIFIVVVVVALYFLFLRPNQQRAKRQREESAAIGVGDRVVSIGGIVGTIEEMDGDRVVLLTGDHDAGPGDPEPTRLVMLRSAISRKAPVPTPAPEPAEGETDASGSDDGRSEGDAGA